MKLYLALSITLFHITLTLIKRNPIAKDATTKIVLIRNSNLYDNSATGISKAMTTEKLTNQKRTDYRFLKKHHLVNENICNRIF
ncbi:MAG: hypothetical protein JKY44_08050 [Flavobacteriaceae bacterium]|nr:hypothetical protein [Flavobacteriaceae bacterium]